MQTGNHSLQAYRFNGSPWAQVLFPHVSDLLDPSRWVQETVPGSLLQTSSRNWSLDHLDSPARNSQPSAFQQVPSYERHQTGEPLKVDWSLESQGIPSEEFQEGEWCILLYIKKKSSLWFKARLTITKPSLCFKVSPCLSRCSHFTNSTLATSGHTGFLQVARIAIPKTKTRYTKLQ